MKQTDRHSSDSYHSDWPRSEDSPDAELADCLDEAQRQECKNE